MDRERYETPAHWDPSEGSNFHRLSKAYIRADCNLEPIPGDNEDEKRIKLEMKEEDGHPQEKQTPTLSTPNASTGLDLKPDLKPEIESEVSTQQNESANSTHSAPSLTPFSGQSAESRATTVKLEDAIVSPNKDQTPGHSQLSSRRVSRAASASPEPKPRIQQQSPPGLDKIPLFRDFEDSEDEELLTTRNKNNAADDDGIDADVDIRFDDEPFFTCDEAWSESDDEYHSAVSENENPVTPTVPAKRVGRPSNREVLHTDGGYVTNYHTSDVPNRKKRRRKSRSRSRQREKSFKRILQVGPLKVSTMTTRLKMLQKLNAEQASIKGLERKHVFGQIKYEATEADKLKEAIDLVLQARGTQQQTPANVTSAPAVLADDGLDEYEDDEEEILPENPVFVHRDQMRPISEEEAIREWFHHKEGEGNSTENIYIDFNIVPNPQERNEIKRRLIKAAGLPDILNYATLTKDYTFLKQIGLMSPNEELPGSIPVYCIPARYKNIQTQFSERVGGKSSKTFMKTSSTTYKIEDTPNVAERLKVQFLQHIMEADDDASLHLKAAKPMLFSPFKPHRIGRGLPVDVSTEREQIRASYLFENSMKKLNDKNRYIRVTMNVLMLVWSMVFQPASIGLKEELNMKPVDVLFRVWRTMPAYWDYLIQLARILVASSKLARAFSKPRNQAKLRLMVEEATKNEGVVFIGSDSIAQQYDQFNTRMEQYQDFLYNN